MLSSIRPYGLPAEPARQAPAGRPAPGPAEVPVDGGRTAPVPKPAPTPTPVPADPGRTAPAAGLVPTPALPPVDEAAAIASLAVGLTYRADGRASEGPPTPTGQYFDRRG
jgi:hypothetical protein